MLFKYIYKRDNAALAADVLFMIKETNGTIESISYSQNGEDIYVLTDISKHMLDRCFDPETINVQTVGMDKIYSLTL